MNKTKKLTLQRLREALTYDPETGLFHWRIRASTRRPAGAVAGRLNSQGYVQIQIDGVGYQAHRLAWLYVNGVWPEGQIDHIDGNRSGNELRNLRDVPGLMNCENRRRAQRNNRQGILGVRRVSANRFDARIRIDGQLVTLGYFATEAVAQAAYVEAKRRHHKGCTL